jgi:transcriptional regulator with XRE-family HTH domain
MAHVDDIISRVRAEAERTKPATLAREAGLGINTLRGLHSANWNPRVETLRKLEQYLERRERDAPPEQRVA